MANYRSNFEICKGFLEMGKILELKQALGPGSRANKYRVHMSIPNAVPKTADLSTFDTLCIATSFPQKDLGVIETYNQGRKLVIPGDTSYPNEWTVTFYNTEEHNIRRAFLEWMRAIDHFQDNVHSGMPIEIMTDMAVSQLDSAQNETVRYTFHGVFPKSVNAITVGDDQQDTITQTEVTFAFTDWVVGDSQLDTPLGYNTRTGNFIA